MQQVGRALAALMMAIVIWRCMPWFPPEALIPALGGAVAVDALIRRLRHTAVDGYLSVRYRRAAGWRWIAGVTMAG